VQWGRWKDCSLENGDSFATLRWKRLELLKTLQMVSGNTGQRAGWKMENDGRFEVGKWKDLEGCERREPSDCIREVLFGRMENDGGCKFLRLEG
jgi:hypothetical protein